MFIEHFDMILCADQNLSIHHVPHSSCALSLAGEMKGNGFLNGFVSLFPERVWTNTMGLGRRKGFKNMGLPSFSWEGVRKYDGPWEGEQGL